MDKEIIFLDEKYESINYIEEDCLNVKPLIKSFIASYSENQNKPIEEWLFYEILEELPEKQPEEIRKMVKEIMMTLENDEINKLSLINAIANGKSKESWLASKIQKSTSAMSVQKSVEFLVDLDKALEDANAALFTQITTQSRKIKAMDRHCRIKYGLLQKLFIIRNICRFLTGN